MLSHIDIVSSSVRGNSTSNLITNNVWVARQKLVAGFEVSTYRTGPYPSLSNFTNGMNKKSVFLARFRGETIGSLRPIFGGSPNFFFFLCKGGGGRSAKIFLK